MKKERLKEFYMEVVVGFVVFLILIILGVFTIILSRESLLRKSYSVNVVFDHINGLIEGDNVLMRGVKIGTVKSFIVKTNGVYVKVNVECPLEFHEGYKIQIVSSSVLGGHNLEIDTGPFNMPLIAVNAQLKGAAPTDLVRDATELIAIVKNSLVAGGILTNIESSAANLNNIIAKVNKGEGLLGKLINEDKIYNDITRISSNVAVISDRLVKGEGTLGKLSKNEDLYDDLKQLIQEARTTLDDLRETSPIVSFSSMFFGAF